MGWPPREVAASSLWQFRAAAVGWAEANGAQRDLDDDAFDRAGALFDAAPETRT